MSVLRNIEKPLNTISLRSAQRDRSPWRLIKDEKIEFGDMVEHRARVLTPAKRHDVGLYPHELPWLIDLKFPHVFRKK